MIPIKTKILPFYLGVLGALAVSFSCSPKIQKLEIVRFGNFRLDSITHEIITLRAEVEVRNPYSSSARLKNISFDLAVTDHPIAYGKLVGSTELSGNATHVMDVPLAIQCKQLTEKDFTAIFGKMISYHLKGNAVLEKPFGPRTLPIDVHGEIEAKEDLQFLLSNKTATQVIALDASGTHELAELIRQRKISLRFFNPFSFPVNVENFHTDLHLGKASIAEGIADEPLNLKPGNNRFSLRVQPRTTGAASEILDFLFNKKIPDLTVSSDFALVRNSKRLHIKLIYAP